MTGDIEDLCSYVPIPGFTRYEVLNVYPYIVRNRATERVLKPMLDAAGYYHFDLRNDDGERKKYKLHRIIADIFIPNPHGYPCVDHVNRNKTDNHLSNLRWVPYSVNTRNITQKMSAVYTWIDTPPDDTVPVTQFNGWSFDRLHYSRSADMFFTDCMGQYRELVIHINPHSERRFIRIKDSNCIDRSVYIIKFKRLNNIPA